MHRQETGLLASLRQAAGERRRAGIDPVPIEVAGIPGRYVSSEQTAIAAFLGGGPAKPAFTPPRLDERGVRGRPTLENNVETLAHLALIARYGDGWFRSIGLPSARPGRPWSPWAAPWPGPGSTRSSSAPPSGTSS